MNTFGFGPWISPLLSGLWVTVWATIVGSVLACILAVFFGLVLDSRFAAARRVVRAVVELFRGTSLVVQLFWIVYALPLITGYQINNSVGAVVALGLNFGAYGAEVVRGALRAVPQTQYEACTALNLGWRHRMRRVIAPQAMPLMIPPATNLAIQLIKSTPLMFLVGVVDLFTVGDQMRQQQPGSALLIYGGLLIAFYLLSSIVTSFAQLLENRAQRRLGKPKVRIQSPDLVTRSRP